jgi:hypothetical protein
VSFVLGVFPPTNFHFGSASLQRRLLTWQPSTPMKHGRIIRVAERQSYTTYIVAEENAAKAQALMRTVVGPTPVVQSIGRASLKLLSAVGLSAGEYKKAQDY